MATEARRASSRVAARVAMAPTPPSPPAPAAPPPRRSGRVVPPKPAPRPPPPSTQKTKAAAKKAASKKKSKKQQQRSNARRKTLPHMLRDDQGREVWIAALLAGDIKRAQKTGKHPLHAKRLYLHTIATPAYRHTVYERLARAWEDLEQALLPTYGDRPWKVKVTIKDPVNAKGHPVSPFFYYHHGGASLELAAWPHWLLAIPQPPRFPGYAKAAEKAKPPPVADEGTTPNDDNEVDGEEEEDEEEEEEEEEEELDEEMKDWEDLQRRQVSSLSELAMAERWRVPIPSYSIKWLSPLHETFTTRKSAWAHAKTLCQQEVFLDKVLSGYNANGQAITKIATHGAKTILKAGHWRFLRDGLWVIGQEEVWQRQRVAELQALPASVVTPPATPRTGSSSSCTPLALYIRENRKSHQAKRQLELSAEKGEKASFTLREAESELRTLWKGLPQPERDSWIQRAGVARATTATALAASPMEAEVQAESLTEDTTSDAKLPARPSPPSSTDANAADTTSATAAAAPAVSADAGRVTPPSETDVTFEKPKPSSKVLSVEYATKPLLPTSSDTPSSESQAAVVSRSSKPPTPPKGPNTQVTILDSKPSPSRAWRLNKDQIKLCYDAGLDHYDRVLKTVKARDLTREFQDGFDVLRERGRGRFDMELPEFDEPSFSFLTNQKKTPWMPVVRQILGKDVVLIHKGIFLSLPGAAKQEYHQDGPHLTTQYQKPCHAINVFVPLVDLEMSNGPTEFCLGSHILGHEDWDENFIETPTARAGCPVIFDYRLGHRGLANTSDGCRPILYCTYAAAADGKEFRDSVNFSRKRYHKIGDMVSKALSREERAQKRQKID